MRVLNAPMEAGQLYATAKCLCEPDPFRSAYPLSNHVSDYSFTPTHSIDDSTTDG